MIHLVIRVEHDSGGRTHHLRECLPSNLGLSERSPREYLVAGNLPLNLDVSVGTFAELSAGPPASLEWPYREPVNAYQQKSNGNWQWRSA